MSVQPIDVLSRLPAGANVVVIRLRSLGDTVLTTPALALIKQARPDLRLCVVLDRPFAPLLTGAPDVDEVVAVERGRIVSAVQAIRRLRPALCLNLHGGSSSAWMTLLSGAGHRAGYAHFSRAFAYNVLIPCAQEILGRPTDAPVHTAEHHASAAFYLGADRVEIPRARLAAAPLERERPYAVLHVAAAYETKRWPEERFLAIGRLVRDQYGLEPIVIAGPGQDALLAKFDEFRCAPGLSIRKMMQLLAGAKLFVGNDSGPAHVAAAYSVPSVVIFGSSSSVIWGPWRTPHAVVETDWECKPCPGDRCYVHDEPRCILSVTATSVEAAVARLLT